MLQFSSNLFRPIYVKTLKALIPAPKANSKNSYTPIFLIHLRKKIKIK